MKRIYTMLWMCLLVMMTWAQETGFVEENTAWRYDEYMIDANSGYKYNTEQAFYYVQGMQTVGGREYHVLHACMLGVGARRDVENPFAPFSVFIREESGRVYVERQSFEDFMDNSYQTKKGSYRHLTADESEVLLYDFTLGVGSVYPHKDNPTVETVDFVVLNDGSTKKRLTLSNGMEVVEDIGCVNGYGELLNYQSWPTFMVNEYYSKATKMKYYKNVKADVLNTWYSEDIDAPCLYSHNGLEGEGITSVKTEMPATPGLFDLQGRRVNGQPQRGIYVKDGRKTMVK